jgi:hypothetical protein
LRFRWSSKAFQSLSDKVALGFCRKTGDQHEHGACLALPSASDRPQAQIKSRLKAKIIKLRTSVRPITIRTFSTRPEPGSGTG